MLVRGEGSDGCWGRGTRRVLLFANPRLRRLIRRHLFICHSSTLQVRRARSINRESILSNIVIEAREV